MKSCAKYHGWYSCLLEQHPKADGQVEDEGEPVDDQDVRLLGGQKETARASVVTSLVSRDYHRGESPRLLEETLGIRVELISTRWPRITVDTFL